MPAPLLRWDTVPTRYDDDGLVTRPKTGGATLANDEGYPANLHHAPADYDCPFCRVAAGVEVPTAKTRQTDVVLREERVMAFVASKWWPNNPGHVLVVPTAHYENIFDLPPALGAHIQRAARAVAFAMKAVYACDGVSTRQHNEPAGQQDVWHYHLHVYPRYHSDKLYFTLGSDSDPGARAALAARLREWLESHPLVL